MRSWPSLFCRCVRTADCATSPKTRNRPVPNLASFARWDCSTVQGGRAMGINTTNVRKGLQAFDLQRVFVEELGWDRHASAMQIPLDGRTYPLSAIAQKRGMV